MVLYLIVDMAYNGFDVFIFYSSLKAQGSMIMLTLQLNYATH